MSKIEARQTAAGATFSFPLFHLPCGLAMRLLIGFIFGVVMTGSAALLVRDFRHHQTAQSAPPAQDIRQAIPEKYIGEHQAIIEAEHRGPVGVLFLGDSITDFWRTVPWEWDAAFGKYHPVNAGIIFDRIGTVRWRIENGELDGIHPRVIVLEIGTNDIASGNADPNVVAYAIADLVREIHGRLPESHVLVLGLFPRFDGFGYAAQQTNAQLEKLMIGPGVSYFDLGPKLPREDFSDEVHPNPDGYRRWAQTIAPMLKELFDSQASKSL